MHQTNTQKLLSSILTVNKLNDNKLLENRIKLVNSCFFQDNSDEKRIFTAIKTLFSTNKSTFLLEELLTIIQHQNPKTKINIDQLTKLNNITIDNLEFTTLFQNSITTIYRAKFLNEFKKDAEKINIYQYDDNQLNQIASKIIEFQNNFQNNTAKFNLNQFAKDYFKENSTANQTKINKQQHCYLTSKYPIFNKLIGGIKNGELIIYSADSGFGKSTFALNLMFQLADYSKQNNLNNPKITMVNYEMSMNDIFERILAIKNKNNVTLTTIRSGNYYTTNEYLTLDPTKKVEVSHEFESIRQVEDSLKDYPFFNFNLPFYNADISHLEQYVRLEKQKNEIDILIVDHLHLMKDNSEPGFVERTDSIVWKLKMLALSLDIPIILLAQFNKESSKDKEKNMHSMKGSAGIAQHANVVFTLSQKPVSKQKNNDENPYIELTEESDIIDVILTIHKNRQGRTGKIAFQFDKPHQKFIEVNFTNQTETINPTTPTINQRQEATTDAISDDSAEY